MQNNSQVLHFVRNEYGYEGKYKCVATNSVGNDSKEVSVKFIGNAGNRNSIVSDEYIYLFFPIKVSKIFYKVPTVDFGTGLSFSCNVCVSFSVKFILLNMSIMLHYNAFLNIAA